MIGLQCISPDVPLPLCPSLPPPCPLLCSLGVPGHAKNAAHRCLAAPRSATRRIFPLAQKCPRFTSLTSQRSPLRHQYCVGLYGSQLSSSTVDMLPTYFLRFLLHFVMQNLSRALSLCKIEFQTRRIAHECPGIFILFI